MDDAGLSSYPGESPAIGLLDAVRSLPQPTQGWRKWTREENSELMVCYYIARLQGKGYRNCLKNFWDARNPSKCIRSENNLCYQARAVIHSKPLIEFELQAIQQSVSHQTNTASEACANPATSINPTTCEPRVVTTECNVMELNEPSNENALVADIGSVDAANPVFDLTASPAADVPLLTNREYDSLLSCCRHCAASATSELKEIFDQVILFLQDLDSACFSSRTTVSKVTETKLIKDLIRLANKCISEIMMAMQLDLLECNSLVYAAAKAVVYISEGQSTGTTGGWSNHGQWRDHLTSRIYKLRKHLVSINSSTILTPKLFSIKRHLFKLYGINSVHSFLIAVETLKQKIKCSAARLRKYNDRVTQYKQNSMFRSNQ